MRGKQATVNKKIKDVLGEYCKLYVQEFDTTFDRCESGNFPWLLSSSQIGLGKDLSKDSYLFVHSVLTSHYYYFHLLLCYLIVTIWLKIFWQ